MKTLKQILIIKTSFWKRLSVYIKKWILQDSIQGKLQELTGKANLSFQYAKYKANFMNRFTTKTGRKKKVKAMTIEGRFRITTGGKLKAYKGVSIKSNIPKPNMYLTGQTIGGLHYQSSTNKSLTMSYMQKDAGKIEGNEALGRSVRTLNEENIEKTRKMIEEELYNNVKEYYKEKIVINIGRAA